MPLALDVDGNFKVTVEHESETVLVWEGYSCNLTDALYKAIEKRDEETSGEETD